MNTQELLRLLGLSKKEEKVLLALQGGATTPLLLARETKVSRTAVYAILIKLKKRGLVKRHTTHGKHHWELAPEREIEEVLYGAKRALLQIPEGREEMHGLLDSMVILHRGKEAVRKVIMGMLGEHKHEHFYATMGSAAAPAWGNIFSTEDLNRFNRTVKQNGIIAEGLQEDGWLEKEAVRLGMSWAKDFEGRTSRVNVLGSEYFQHGAQIFIFKQSMYLLAMREELVIEVRNSEIQKMILSFFKYIQDNSQLIDANELLRKIIAEEETKRV